MSETTFSCRQHGAAALVKMCVGQEQWQRKAKVPAAHLCTSLHSCRPVLHIRHSQSRFMLLFAAGKNTQHTATFQPQCDCHSVPTWRLLEVWTRAIFTTHPCLGSHFPFLYPSVNCQGAPPARVEAQSTQWLVQGCISPLKTFLVLLTPRIPHSPKKLMAPLSESARANCWMTQTRRPASAADWDKRWKKKIIMEHSWPISMFKFCRD